MARLLLPACLSIAMGASGCSLLLGYPSDGQESGDDACHDEVDNDGDGAIDCLDESCGLCATRPRIECPEGWARTRLDGAPSYLFTCTPTFSPFDGCPAAPPAGAVIVPAGEDQLPAVYPATGLEAEVWLAPGRHDEDIQLMPSRGTIRGYCDGETVPELVVHGDATSAWAVDQMAIRYVSLDLGHVAGVSVSGGPFSSVSFEHGALLGTEARVAVTGPGAVEISASRIEPTIDVVSGTVEIHDSRVGELTASASRVSLTRVRSEDRVMIDGAASSLSAETAFVRCAIRGRGGSSLALREVVVEGESVTQLYGRAGTVTSGSVTLEDVVVAAGHPDCRTVRGGVQGGLAVVDLRRVLVWGPRYGLDLDNSRGTARDLTLLDDGLAEGPDIFSRGVMSYYSSMTLENVLIVGARIGIWIEAVPPDGHVTIDSVEVRGDDPATCVSTSASSCAYAGAGIAVLGTGDSRPRVVTLTDVDVTNVDGCGIVLRDPDPGTTIQGTVRDSRIGLCAPGQDDTVDLASTLTLLGNGEDYDSRADACVDGSCR